MVESTERKTKPLKRNHVKKLTIVLHTWLPTGKVLEPHSQAICVSDLSGGKLPSGIDCFFSPSNELPVGVRIHAFTSGAHDYGKHNIVLSNDTHKAIKLSRGFPLSAIYYKYTSLATKNTLAPTYGPAQSNTEGPVPSTHPNTHTHTPTQHEKNQVNSMTTQNPTMGIPSIDTLFDTVVPSNLDPLAYNNLKSCLHDYLFAFTPKQPGTTGTTPPNATRPSRS